VSAAPDVDDSDERSPWSAFPVIAYSPETSLMLGGGFVYTFETDSEPPDASEHLRRSSILLASAYTFERQFFVAVAPSVYWGRETWHASQELNARLFPSTYYPVGEDTPNDSAEDYTDRGVSVFAELTRRLVGAFSTGGEAYVLYSDISDAEAGGDLSGNRVLGSEGVLLAGLGPILVFDDRDNDFATHRGGRYALSALYFPQAFGSDYDVSKYFLDVRHFFPLGGEHVLGARLHGEATLGRVPFQVMATLGGSKAMRGFYEGRYRDLHGFTVQTEYRFPLLWRFGGTVFGSVGEVAPRLDGFDAEHLRAAGGAGLRFSLNQADRVNLRFDAATTSTGDVNFYVDLGEAF